LLTYQDVVVVVVISVLYM